MMSKRFIVLACLLVALRNGPAIAENTTLLLATTTSVRDTGLLDTLLPSFLAESGIAVKPIAVGTGAALRMGAEGNVDVLLTHAPEAEAELVRSGVLVERQPFMENYFVIVGPQKDPAGVRAAESAAAAFRRIAAAGGAVREPRRRFGNAQARTRTAACRRARSRRELGGILPDR